MSRDLQNICSRTKKKTRVEILKFESKNKAQVELKKKKIESRKRERLPVVLSIDVFTSPIRVKPAKTSVSPRSSPLGPFRAEFRFL